MRSIVLMAAALTLSSAAVAQITPTPTPRTGDPQTALPDPATNAPADSGTMQEMQNDPAVQTPPQTETAIPMQPTAQPATPGTMPIQAPAMRNMAGMQPQASTGTYPRCSRTVTDRCTQIGARR